MKRYRVTVREVVLYQVDVEAEDEDDAADIACNAVIANADRDEWSEGVEEREASNIFENPPNWKGITQ